MDKQRDHHDERFLRSGMYVEELYMILKERMQRSTRTRGLVVVFQAIKHDYDNALQDGGNVLYCTEAVRVEPDWQDYRFDNLVFYNYEPDDKQAPPDHRDEQVRKITKDWVEAREDGYAAREAGKPRVSPSAVPWPTYTQWWLLGWDIADVTLREVDLFDITMKLRTERGHHA